MMIRRDICKFEMKEDCIMLETLSVNVEILVHVTKEMDWYQSL